MLPTISALIDSESLRSAVGRAGKRLRPPPRRPLSEWIESTLRLPEGLAAKPGPVRLWPFQKGIADAISDPAIERVSVRKSARVGFSTLLTGTIASYVANEPAPILYLLPTEDDCRDYVVSDMEPVFEATPVLKGLLLDEQDETGRNTIRHRRFPGGSLKIVAAKSPRNLRRHTVRILLIDEEDGMEATAEGDPVDLAIKRTLTFANRKIIRGSTPVDLETSTICREYDASDRRVFEMKCVECGEFAEPTWEQIQWEKGKPETARWACPHCGTLIQERYKMQMVADGRWRATRPEVEGHAGFKLNSLISPHFNASWGKLAAEYLQVYQDPDRLRAFKNTLLGEPWSEAVDASDPDDLFASVEDFGLNVTMEDGTELRIPQEVLVITAGIDVQDDRLEMNVYGWSRSDHPYALGHFVIWGSPGEPTTWAELDAALSTKWVHPLGGKIGIDAACVDAGDGGWVDEVYAFCWPRARRKIVAIKGAAGNRPIIEGSKGKVAKGTVSGKGRLWIVGVDTVKSQLLMRIARYRETIHFSRSLPLAWFEQLLSERRVIKKIGGRPVKRFERIPGLAAEALDATVYAIAARQLVAVTDYERREQELRAGFATDAAPNGVRGRRVLSRGI
jgi:phage terminase large subunit GpA-like protein